MGCSTAAHTDVMARCLQTFGHIVYGECWQVPMVSVDYQCFVKYLSHIVNPDFSLGEKTTKDAEKRLTPWKRSKITIQGEIEFSFHFHAHWKIEGLPDVAASELVCRTL